MLVLSRKIGQSIVLNTSDGEIRIVVHNITRQGVKIGIKASTAVEVLRDELTSRDRGRRNPGDE